jgi:thioredoxin-related protein
MSYPTIVYLDEQYRRIMISPGYKESGDLLKELKFAKEEQYNKTSWEEYKNKGE